jgi:hypothetical protein
LFFSAWPTKQKNEFEKQLALLELMEQVLEAEELLEMEQADGLLAPLTCWN